MGNVIEYDKMEGGLLSNQLNDAELYLLKSFENHPHRFKPTTPEAPAVALMISKLFALGLIHVDREETSDEAIISLSMKGLEFIFNRYKLLANYLH